MPNQYNGLFGPVSVPSDIRIAQAIVLLEEIVCTKGCDAGVVLLSQEAPCHQEPDYQHPGQTVAVYNLKYFSPLGTALMELHQILTGTQLTGKEPDDAQQHA